MGIYNEIMGRGLYEISDEKSFTWTGCDVCRERTGELLGGDVYEAKGYKDLEAAKKKDHYDFNVCAGCVCAFANGDDFPEEGE